MVRKLRRQRQAYSDESSDAEASLELDTMQPQLGQPSSWSDLAAHNLRRTTVNLAEGENGRTGSGSLARPGYCPSGVGEERRIEGIYHPTIEDRQGLGHRHSPPSRVATPSSLTSTHQRTEREQENKIPAESRDGQLRSAQKQFAGPPTPSEPNDRDISRCLPGILETSKSSSRPGSPQSLPASSILKRPAVTPPPDAQSVSDGQSRATRFAFPIRKHTAENKSPSKYNPHFADEDPDLLGKPKKGVTFGKNQIKEFGRTPLGSQENSRDNSAAGSASGTVASSDGSDNSGSSSQRTSSEQR